MINGWTDSLLAGIQTLNQILTAGIAITAFSLFLYALSFNLRDRVARSFAIILLCVVIVFTTEALQDKSLSTRGIDLLLRLQWFGIVFLPAAYLHLSDALLVTAGRPSRGRRRFAVRGMYAVSAVFLLLLAYGQLLGPLVPEGVPAPHLERTVWTEIFTLFYVSAMVLPPDAHPFRPTPNAVSHGWRNRTRPRILSLSIIRLRPGGTPSLPVLGGGYSHQPVGRCSGHRDGVFGGLLWGILA
jgi:hypothetical protein